MVTAIKTVCIKQVVIQWFNSDNTMMKLRHTHSHRQTHTHTHTHSLTHTRRHTLTQSVTHSHTHTHTHTHSLTHSQTHIHTDRHTTDLHRGQWRGYWERQCERKPSWLGGLAWKYPIRSVPSRVTSFLSLSLTLILINKSYWKKVSFLRRWKRLLFILKKTLSYKYMQNSCFFYISCFGNGRMRDVPANDVIAFLVV